MACLHDYGRYKEGGYVLVDVINKHLGGWYPKLYNLHVTESIALIIIILGEYCFRIQVDVILFL